MKPNLVWIIVPFSREKFFNNLINNIKRQTFSNIKVCIVENGDGLGVCKKNNFTPDLLLSSEKHQSAAKNAALDAIKSLGGGYTTVFDDDDYYGPNYIQEVVDSAELSEVTGKLGLIAKLSDDKMYVFHYNGICMGFTQWVQGSTISCWAEDAIFYETNLKFAEEMRWCRQMTLNGARIFSTSIYNYCYMRYKNHNHTFEEDDRLIKNSHLIYDSFDENIINKVTEHEFLKLTEGYVLKFPNIWYEKIMRLEASGVPYNKKHLGIIQLFNKQK